MTKLNAALLYNCQTANAAPDWSIYSRLELSGVILNTDDDGGTNCEAAQTATRADIFTIYARQHADSDGIEFADAITDCYDAITALEIGAALSRLSGLPCSLDVALSDAHAITPRYTVDGTGDDGGLLGDGKSAPFRIFDVVKQEHTIVIFKERSAAQVIVDELNGAKP